MNKQTISKILSLLFLVSIFVTAVIVNSLKPRVMILHSYHPDYAWTREIDVGLRRVADSWVDYTVTWHYMDTKKHKDKEWLNRAGIIARRAIDRADPQVLIAIDDFAQSLAAKYYVDKPGLSIVFGGVNGTVDAYNYNEASNVTGIFEHKQLQPIKETVLTIERGRKDAKINPKLIYLMDPSASIKRGRAKIDGFTWGPIQYDGSIIARNFEQWKEIVRTEGKEVDYILVSNYRKLPKSPNDKNFMDPKQVMTWTESNSPVPVIGINSFNVEDGAMLSVGVSPYEQGEVVAKMSEKIIDEGIPANQIPFQKNKMYIIALRKESLHKRNIALPTIYEAFGRATEHYIE